MLQQTCLSTTKTYTWQLYDDTCQERQFASCQLRQTKNMPDELMYASVSYTNAPVNSAVPRSTTLRQGYPAPPSS